DRTQREKIPVFTQIKKITNRVISFIAGGFYGFGLGQQIAIESNLGFKLFLKTFALPIVIIILPLIIINAFANLITYHLNKRQRDKLFFAEHIDSKLQELEYTRKKIWYLSASLKSLSTATLESNGNQQQINLITKDDQTFFRKKKSNFPVPHTKFFKSQSTTQIDLLGRPEKEHLQKHISLTP
ncbi:MAG: hypothetical protein REH83_01315, partial [Rickettsiella sp.]|nr:hypothetical protein [Rickettsiella sp.]